MHACSMRLMYARWAWYNRDMCDTVSYTCHHTLWQCICFTDATWNNPCRCLIHPPSFNWLKIYPVCFKWLGSSRGFWALLNQVAWTSSYSSWIKLTWIKAQSSWVNRPISHRQSRLDCDWVSSWFKQILFERFNLLNQAIKPLREFSHECPIHIALRHPGPVVGGHTADQLEIMIIMMMTP